MKIARIVAITTCLAGVTLLVARHAPRLETTSPAREPGPAPLVMTRAAYRAETSPSPGLVVVTQPGATGVALEAQRGAKARLERSNPVPEERRERFRWVAQWSGVITGWDGTIEDITPAEGGVRVKLAVYPRHTANGVDAINGQAFESYLLVGDEIRYLGTEDRPGSGILTFN